MNLPSLFTDPSAFRSALIHRSYCNEHPREKSNERLEFLGDSVLSLIISERLYKLLPHLPEGELTARRSYLVQTSSLAQKSRQLGLDELLLLSHGEEDSGGRNNPGLLANVFEAVLGALYLDSGLPASHQFLSQIFPDSELVADTLPTKDPKSQLQELSQANGWGTPVYSTLSTTGPDHAKTFTVSVTVNSRQFKGTGSSKQRAQTEAARSALSTLC